jgi:hypothetical protein
VSLKHLRKHTRVENLHIASSQDVFVCTDERVINPICAFFQISRSVLIGETGPPVFLNWIANLLLQAPCGRKIEGAGTHCGQATQPLHPLVVLLADYSGNPAGD